MSSDDRSAGKSAPGEPGRGTPLWRWLRRLVLWPLVLVFIVLALLLAAPFTETGTRLIARGAERALGDRLTLGPVEGTLADSVTVQGIRYSSAPHDVSVARLSFDWRPGALFDSLFHVQHVAVEGVSYVGPPPDPTEPESGPPALDVDVALPIDVRVDRLEVTNVRVQQGVDASTAMTVDRLFAKDVEATGAARIGLVEIESMGASVSASGQLGLQTPNVVSLDLDWSYMLSDPAVDARGSATIGGRLRAVDLAHTLTLTSSAAGAQPASVALTGSIALPRGAAYPEVDLSAKWQDLAWPLDSAPAQFASRSGQLALEGKPEKVFLRLTGDAAVPQLPLDAVFVELEGRLDPADPIGTAHFDLVWKLEPGAGAPVETGPIAGSGTVRSNGLTLDVEHSASAPFEIDLVAQLDRKHEGTEFTVDNVDRLDVRLDWRELRWPLDGKPEYHSAKGTLTLAGKPEAFALALNSDATAGGVALETVELALDTTLDPKQPLSATRATLNWQIRPEPGGPIKVDLISGATAVTVKNGARQLEVAHQSTAPFDVKLDASLNRQSAGTQLALTDIDDIKLALDWRGLRWPLQGEPEFASAAGNLVLTGKPQDFSLKLDTDATAGGVALDSIGLELQAQIDPSEPLSAGRATMDWQARPRPGGPIDVELLSGRTVLSVAQDGRQLSVEHRSTAPFQVDMDASVQRRSSGAAFDAADLESLKLALAWRDLRWPLVGQAQYASRDGSLELNGSPEALTLAFASQLSVPGVPVKSIGVDVSGSVQPEAPYAFDLDARWRSSLDASVSGEAFDASGAGRFTGDASAIRLNHKLDVPFALTTRGRVEVAAGTPALDLEGDWLALAWPPHPGAASIVESPAGNYTVAGTIDDLAVSASANAHGKDLPDLVLDASAQVQPAGTPRLVLNVRTLGGTASVQGSAEWTPAVAFDVALAADDINPGIRWPNADGKLSLRAGLTGAVSDNRPELRLRLERLNGHLRGQPVAGAGEVALNGAAVSARNLRVSSGANSVKLNGEVGEQAALRFDLDAPELATLWPGLRGAARGNGRIAGARERPRIEAAIDANGLGIDTLELASLTLRANIDSADRRPTQFSLGMRGMDIGGNKIDSLDLNGNGTLASHRVTLAMNAPQAEISTRASGSLNVQGPTWAGQLDTLNASIKDAGGHGLGRWSMPGPAAIEAGAEAVRARPICLTQSGARLCVEGRWRASDGIDGALNATSVPLSLIGPWLPPNLRLEGTLGVSATGRGKGQNLSANARASVSGTRVVLEQADGSPIALNLSRTELSAAYGGGRADIDTRLDLAGGGGIKGSAKLGPAGAGGVRSLSAEIEGGLPDLELLAAFTDDLADLKGRVEMNASVSGSTARPAVRGGIRVVEAGALVPGAGIRIAPLDLSVKGDGGERLQFEGEARSGGGALRISGAVGLNAARGWPSSVRVEGERFQAAKLPNVELFVSPALDVALDRGALSVSGTVTVPEATIVIEELPSSAVNLSSDEVIVRRSDGTVPEPGANGRTDLPVVLSIEVVIGDAVTFEGFGLLTRLAGRLRFRQRPGQQPSAVGELELVDGTYKAYGQDLSIERGRLIFNGPLDNPGIDVRATRTAGNVVAGIELKGTVNALESSLFSVPSLSQAETLSYLLTGGPLSGASKDEGAVLAQAAFALGASNSQGLTAEIASTFGLDELSVVGSGVEDAGVQVGKRLGERLHARYIVGLFDTLGSLLVTYKLTDSLSLESQSGRSQGLELKYSIEREHLFGGSDKKR